MEENNFLELAKLAKAASKKIAFLSTEIKNKALLNIAEALDSSIDKIFEANKKDLELALPLDPMPKFGTRPILL